MPRPLAIMLCAIATSSFSFADKPKVVPDINESKEYPGVFHSPSADSTPAAFRSVVQMEIVVSGKSEEAELLYANGTLVSNDGKLVSVINGPADKVKPKVESAAVLMLDGSSAEAELLVHDADNGVAIFQVSGLDLRPLRLAKGPFVANRRMNWNTVFRNGQKTCLYRRPLRLYKSSYDAATNGDLCQVIDLASSSLHDERSGSALIGLDGTVHAIMGRQEHWNVTPKHISPRTKTAWAVPAATIAKMLDSTSGAQ